MIRTIEAVVDEQGTVRLLDTVTLPHGRRALVTILDEPPAIPHEAALLSEIFYLRDLPPVLQPPAV